MVYTEVFPSFFEKWLGRKSWHFKTYVLFLKLSWELHVTTCNSMFINHFNEWSLKIHITCSRGNVKVGRQMQVTRNCRYSLLCNDLVFRCKNNDRRLTLFFLKRHGYSRFFFYFLIMTRKIRNIRNVLNIWVSRYCDCCLKIVSRWSMNLSYISDDLNINCNDQTAINRII